MKSALPLLLNGTITVLDLRIVSSWRGAWVATIELDTDPSTALPTGLVTLNVFDQNLTGTVEPTGTGHFGDRTFVRIVGGANGWPQPVPAKDFANDATLTIDRVIGATAAAVGETIGAAPEIQVGVNYVRTSWGHDGTSAPASRVLFGLDWYVDFNGITWVQTRPVTMPPSDIEALDYDPTTRALTLGAITSLVVPGMIFTDANGRWDGSLTVRDVEQHFTGKGESHAIAWCGIGASSQGVRPLLETLITETIGLPYLKSYPYRLQGQGVDGRLTLQAVKKADGVPDVLPLSVWPGVAGASSTYPLTGVIVMVAFPEGNPTNPIVTSFQPGLTPLTTTLEASDELDVTAPIVKLGMKADAQALTFGTATIALQTILTALLAAMNGDPLLPVLLPATYTGVQAAVTSLAALVASFPETGQTINTEAS